MVQIIQSVKFAFVSVPRRKQAVPTRPGRSELFCPHRLRAHLVQLQAAAGRCRCQTSPAGPVPENSEEVDGDVIICLFSRWRRSIAAAVAFTEGFK